MSTEVRKSTTTDRQAETGWARARRLRGRGVRTCVRATLDGDAGQQRWETWEAEGNVVRGED